MHKVFVDFSIRTEGQEQAFETTGALKGDTLTFHDEKDQKHILILEDRRIEYQRGGNPSFDFIFERGKTHTCDYKVDHNTMTFDIQTHQLLVKEGTIALVYTLRQGDVVVGHSELMIKYERAKEA